MPKSQYDGTLHALFQTPPWQRLQNAVRAADTESGEKKYQFLIYRMSEQLRGDMGSVWLKARKKREAEQAASE